MRALPHSRQILLCRGVMRPQNGHILCDRTSGIGGVRTASSFPNTSPRNASRLRRRRRNGRRTGSIGPCFLPLLGNCLPQGISGRSHRKRPHLRKRRPTYDDRSRQAILYRIAHIPPGASGVATTFCECAHVPQNCSLLTILVPWLPSTIPAYLPRRK